MEAFRLLYLFKTFVYSSSFDFEVVKKYVLNSFRRAYRFELSSNIITMVVIKYIMK